MIAYLSGKFSYKNPAVVYVDVQGVGYEVNISLNTYSHIQQLMKENYILILQIKEDAHTLYGFFDATGKRNVYYVDKCFRRWCSNCEDDVV